MKVYIATPMYGGMCTAVYTHSLLRLYLTLISKGHQVHFNYVMNESLITRARNTLVHEFLKSDSEVLLFIDADHGFDPEEVVRLIEHEAPIIGAIPPMKAIKWETVQLALNSGLMDQVAAYTGIFAVNPLAFDVKTFDRDVAIEVMNVGTGMMKINRHVFNDMLPITDVYANSKINGMTDYEDPVREFFKTDIDDEGFLLSEDYFFCRQWIKLGNKVYAAPWIRITHAGHYVFSGNFADTIALLATQPGLQD